VCCCEGIGEGGVDEHVQSRFMSTRPKFRTADGRVHRAQCLNLEHEFRHTVSKLCILGFEPLK
jgi:hypothetical protein